MQILQVAQTRMFRLRVGDVMGAPWPRVNPQSTWRSAVRLMREHVQPGVVVVDAGNRLVGILNEGDLLREVQPGATPDLPVDRIMRSPVFTARHHDLLFHAIALMRRVGVKQLPVLDRSGRITGNLALEAALSVPMDRLLSLADGLSRGNAPQELREVKANQVTMARIMLQDGLPTIEVQALLTEVNNDLCTRIVALEVESLADEGWGEPPVPFDVIVMGSGGRGESFLSPDQDNGFVLEDYPDSEHAPVDAYFTELAIRVTRALDRVGIPYCRGHVMATNPLWRKSLSQWKAQIRYWLARPNPATLRLADIFFDFAPVFGDGMLTAGLRRHVTADLSRQHAFLRAMQQTQDEHGVALGPLGRLAVEQTPGVRGGRINLKYRGLLPLVEGIRLLALREGVSPCPTLVRIAQLGDRGALTGDERDYLSQAFVQITELLLRQQIQDLGAGRPAGNHIAPDALTAREKDRLVAALKAIADFRARIRSEFTGAL